MCPLFGLKCLQIDWFWSSFDWLEDISSGITVPYTKNILLFFFGTKNQKRLFSSYLCNFYSLWKMEILRKKSPDHNFFLIFWSWWLWIMYHCIMYPCKFYHLWSSPSWPTWPCSSVSDPYHFDADPDPRICFRDDGSGSNLKSNKFQFFSY